eukprot:TRINITY_DN12270_c1_g1_i1.p1 TRINITY_DN12270_c1_g1~~TRINITY_DN12270_c1_g1_i1.p1  ORF type:complete len:457 (-),score=44.60 TRINITY_DN12270_c1_g1_i1:504-1874(-)
MTTFWTPAMQPSTWSRKPGAATTIMVIIMMVLLAVPQFSMASESDQTGLVTGSGSNNIVVLWPMPFNGQLPLEAYKTEQPTSLDDHAPSSPSPGASRNLATGPTRRPTSKPTTKRPTRRPTSKPTPKPTITCASARGTCVKDCGSSCKNACAAYDVPYTSSQQCYSTGTGAGFCSGDQVCCKCKGTSRPTPAPTATPTAKPTAEPTAEPTAKPTSEPTAEPTAEPTSKPTVEPTAEPTAMPTATPTAAPTAKPTATPTANPTATPTAQPTAQPTIEVCMPGFGSISGITCSACTGNTVSAGGSATSTTCTLCPANDLCLGANADNTACKDSEVALCQDGTSTVSNIKSIVGSGAPPPGYQVVYGYMAPTSACAYCEYPFTQTELPTYTAFTWAFSAAAATVGQQCIVYLINPATCPATPITLILTPTALSEPASTLLYRVGKGLCPPVFQVAAVGP